MEHTFLQKVQIFFIKLMAKVHWKQRRRFSDANMQKLREALAKDYFIIATRKDNQLSTFFICLGHFFLTGRWGYYSHVLMNLEDEVKNEADFRLIEATGEGVHFSTFEEVFAPSYSAALIKPKGLTLEEWTACLDSTKNYLGRPYDNLFDLKNDMEINCVELVRIALQSLPDYATRFKAFEKLIKKEKKLTPQMFADCSDFEVVLRVRR